MISSDDLPLNENGRKKGYVKVMKELLYGRDEGMQVLENLRDQGACKTGENNANGKLVGEY